MDTKAQLRPSTICEELGDYAKVQVICNYNYWKDKLCTLYWLAAHIKHICMCHTKKNPPNIIILDHTNIHLAETVQQHASWGLRLSTVRNILASKSVLLHS